MTPAQESARMTLENIQESASVASDNGFKFKMYSRTYSMSSQTYAAVLNRIRDEVNAMGHETPQLTDEQSTLAPWERKALNDVLPLLRQTADGTEHAIALFEDNPQRLWMHPFYSETERITRETSNIARTLNSYLKHEHAREEEQHFASSIGMGSN